MHDLDGNLMIDHDQLAVRIETARLWLLFIPTALSVGFLGVTSAKETLWRFSLVESFVHSQEAAEIAWGVFRIPVYLAGLGLWIWVTERACIARCGRLQCPILSGQQWSSRLSVCNG